MNVLKANVTRWARGGAIVLAGLASIATSRARWSVAAKLPPAAPPMPGRGTRVLIEASSEPSVLSQRPSDRHPLNAVHEDVGAWPGHGAYFVPAGFELTGASIDGVCSGGMCSRCEAPPDAFVTVKSITPVGAWSIAAASEELVTQIDHDSPFIVQVQSSRDVDLEIVPKGGDVGLLSPSQWRDGPRDTSGRAQFTVNWYARDATTKLPVEARWLVRATIYGACEGAGECRPPEGENIKIVSVLPKGGAPPAAPAAK